MMKRCSWLGGVLAVLVLGVGCGGVKPLDEFKDRTFQLHFMPGSVTTTPAPAGRAVLFASLLMNGPDCNSLSPDVVATVNGDSNVRLGAGGCAFKGSSSPGFTYELDVGSTPQNATIVFEDGTHRMEIEIENLIASYRLQPQKAGFDPSKLYEEGANPVTRGEVLVFDRASDLRPVATFDANLQQDHEVGGRFESTIHDVHPVLDGSRAEITVPTDVKDGMAYLGIRATERPAVLRCEGMRSCEVEVSYGIETTVTVTP